MSTSTIESRTPAPGIRRCFLGKLCPALGGRVSFRARNSFDDRGDIAGASRGGLASLNRPTKKSERQLVRRADPRRRLIPAAFDGKPSCSGRAAKHGQRHGLVDFETRLPGLTGMVEGCFIVRAAEPRRPQKLGYARSACMKSKVGPRGSTGRVHHGPLAQR